MPKVNKEDLCIVYYEVEGEFSVLWKANPNNKKKECICFQTETAHYAVKGWTRKIRKCLMCWGDFV